MPDPKRTVIIIPARGGSKRLPGKNIRLLGGKPLIHHAIDVALAAAPWARVVVSTDDAQIKAVALQRPGIVVDDRPPELAVDATKTEDVLGELLDRPTYQDFDVVGKLLPTCPLRTSAQVRTAFDTLDKSIDAVVSFTPYEFPAQLAITFDDSLMMKSIFGTSPLISGNFRTQDQLPSYRPNGGVYFAWADFFRNTRSFYVGKTKGMLMPRANSVDIDYGEDFEYAQYMIDSGQVKPEGPSP